MPKANRFSLASTREEAHSEDSHEEPRWPGLLRSGWVGSPKRHLSKAKGGVVWTGRVTNAGADNVIDF